MPRATNAVARRKRRKKVLDQAKGYYGRKHSSYRFANEQVMRSDAYAYRDRRNRKRDFRRLWITRINAAARQEGMSYSQLIHGLGEAGVEVNRKMLADIAVNDPDGFRRFVELAREGADGLSRGAHTNSPRAVRKAAALFISGPSESMTITSPQNEKLKLVRRLGAAALRATPTACSSARARTCSRRRRAAGAEPVELLTAAGEGLGGTEVEPELLDSRRLARIGHPRDRGLARGAGPRRSSAPCVYLHGVSDPGNVGTIVRTAAALVGGTVVLGPELRRSLRRPRRAGRAWARSSPSR